MPGAAQPARRSHPGRAALRTPQDHPNTREIGPKQPIPPRSGPQHFHRPQPKQGSHVADPYHNVLCPAGPYKQGWLGLITLTASLLLRGHGWRGCLLPLTVLQHRAAFFSLISGKIPCLQDSSELRSKLTHPQRVHPTGRSSWWAPPLQKRCCSHVLKAGRLQAPPALQPLKTRAPKSPSGLVEAWRSHPPQNVWSILKTGTWGTFLALVLKFRSTRVQTAFLSLLFYKTRWCCYRSAGVKLVFPHSRGFFSIIHTQQVYS